MSFLDHITPQQKKNRDATLPAWPEQNVVDRMIQCATALLVNGLITDGERQRIHQRMLKRYGKAK